MPNPIIERFASNPGSARLTQVHSLLETYNARSVAPLPRSLSTSGRGFFISDPVPSDPAVFGVVDREATILQGLAGVQPYSLIMQAGNGANRDYMYNHSPGSFPDWLKGFNANVGVYNGGNESLLDWDGAVNLWQYADYAVKHDGSIDVLNDGNKALGTINAIIDATKITPEIVWNFYRRFAEQANQTGNANLIKPILKEQQTPKPEQFQNLGLYLGIGVLALFGIGWVLKQT